MYVNSVVMDKNIILDIGLSASFWNISQIYSHQKQNVLLSFCGEFYYYNYKIYKCFLIYVHIYI